MMPTTSATTAATATAAITLILTLRSANEARRDRVPAPVPAERVIALISVLFRPELVGFRPISRSHYAMQGPGGGPDRRIRVVTGSDLIERGAGRRTVRRRARRTAAGTPTGSPRRAA